MDSYLTPMKASVGAEDKLQRGKPREVNRGIVYRHKEVRRG